MRVLCNDVAAVAFLHYYDHHCGDSGVGRDIKCPIIRAPPFASPVDPSTRGAHHYRPSRPTEGSDRCR